MDERTFARNIVQWLNAGVERLDDPSIARLQAAREKALKAYREPVSVLGLATVTGRILDPVDWLKRPAFWVPVVALAFASALYVWNKPLTATYDELGELDAKLLTGELPIDAFLDKDFADWVKESGEQ
jgi:hypothetical protein